MRAYAHWAVAQLADETCSIHISGKTSEIMAPRVLFWGQGLKQTAVLAKGDFWFGAPAFVQDDWRQGITGDDAERIVAHPGLAKAVPAERI